MSAPDCEHWVDIGLPQAGECGRGLFGGRPSHGVCAVCLGNPVLAHDVGGKAAPPWLQSRVAACTVCPEAQRCPHKLAGKPCRFGNWRANPLSVCIRGRWPKDTCFPDLPR